MRPTSIIFIILAVILIVAGIVVGLVGGSMAKAADIQLLSETVDDEGNAITTHNLNEYSVTDFTIDIKNADVNIIGQSV